MGLENGKVIGVCEFKIGTGKGPMTQELCLLSSYAVNLALAFHRVPTTY